MVPLAKKRKSKKIENNSVTIGDNTTIGGDAAIGKGSKVVKNVNIYEKAKKSFQDNPVLYIIAGVIIIVVAGIIMKILYSEKPELILDIQFVRGFDIGCVNYVDAQIEFEIANRGNKPSDFTQFYYIRGIQSKNTCGNNIFFFNKTKPMCLFELIEEGREEQCRSSTRVISEGETVGVRYYFNEESYRLIHTMEKQGISSCEITEELLICSGSEEEKACDRTNVKVKYNECKWI